ncbi:MAG TPA: preprotein translocase subunit SecG [Caldithrix abyssi]|uniref:Protein-export membrane protein SecG n=1 Tax=Caldithrix abyssi TaxID=187145 RepID=A0A7V5H322_CALAY|nr:preprotein translocase subunit SecG [Caldithrix abyssi]
MYTFLIILFIIVSILMVVVILLQSGKGQGLAGSIGGGMGGTSVFGGRGAADFLSKATAWIATIYIILAIMISVIYKSRAESTQKSLIEKRMEEQKQLPAPNIPVAPLPGEQGQQQSQQP